MFCLHCNVHLAAVKIRSYTELRVNLSPPLVIKQVHLSPFVSVSEAVIEQSEVLVIA